jgi:hypothetical protein
MRKNSIKYLYLHLPMRLINFKLCCSWVKNTMLTSLAIVSSWSIGKSSGRTCKHCFVFYVIGLNTFLEAINILHALIILKPQPMKMDYTSIAMHHVIFHKRCLGSPAIFSYCILPLYFYCILSYFLHIFFMLFNMYYVGIFYLKW